MHIKKTLFLLSAICCRILVTNAQITVDAENERPVIESRLKEYATFLLAGDSVSIAAMYAANATIGCKKGPEIMNAAGNWIRSGLKNDSRHVTFMTVTLIADGELLSETGTAEGRNDNGELKYSFRYLVVWKKENSEWKLYRDIAL
jgi:ketosteroid isomerase-like protein